MSNIELNYTMGIIDAKNFTKFYESIDTSEALKKQLVHADKILINKVDLVDIENLEKIESEVKSFNPLVEIRHTEYANADLEYLIEPPSKLQEFKASSPLVDILSEPPAEILVPSASSAFTHGHRSHSSEITPHYITFPGILSLSKAEEFFGKLLWEPSAFSLEEEKPGCVLRCKGLFAAREDGKEEMVMLQGVDDTFECRKVQAGEEGDNRFLFVAKGVDADKIREGLRECIE